jgi:hypothetical protein
LDEGPTVVPVAPVVVEEGPLGVMEDMEVGSMEVTLGVGVDMAWDGQGVFAADQTSNGCVGDEYAGLERVPREVLRSTRGVPCALCIHRMLSPSSSPEILIIDHDAVPFLTGCSG